ncbi:MarR family winged helix-turn-helix transcriptional regulator [Paenibacillus glacialis]|uniref:MarR family transcriptional regulator n=1 Tax=Paenibacillus glacialis TaxID=494026 RepID=A0A168JLU2_9BACL|nr:MarR family transcriptional regulator [Paenibacillus glacialis]OAB40811.1 MarR family transcriptional regulator [Paenibacillus glacialis]
MDKQVLFQKFVAFTTSVHEVTDELTKDVKSDTITPVQYSILEYLAVSQPATLSQISDCLPMSMPNTSRELRKLGEKNLCEKFDVAEDRRKQYIRLSKEGQAMMNEAFQRIEKRFLQRIQGTSEEDLEQIELALDVLSSRVFHSR